MALASFKELLLRRISGDSALEDLIKSLSDEILADAVAESLVKVRTTTTENKGRRANNAVKQFAHKFIDPESHEAEMIRDAIGHHVSHYKAAINDKTIPEDYRKRVAQEHARQVFKLLDLVGTVKPWTNGKLDLTYVDPGPWERNAYNRRERRPDGTFKIDNKNLNLHEHTGYRQNKEKGEDWSFLQQPPHHGEHDQLHEHYHDKAYPFENIAISNHGKNRYVHVDDLPTSPGVYTPHEFDFHPILKHFKEPASARMNGEADQRYLNEQDDFDTLLPHADEFDKRHEALRAANPDTYEKRGIQAAMPVHAETLPPHPDVVADKEKFGHLPPKQRRSKAVVAPPPIPETAAAAAPTIPKQK